MRKQLGIILFAIATVLLVCGVAAQQRSVAGKTVRFHVVGASDSAQDQAVKRQVRDAMLAAMPTWKSREEAVSWLRSHLDTLRSAAEGASNGAPVAVTLCEESYPTRDYDTFRLPAGRYLSLRATVGAGEGRNWWCCVYPSLCACASEDAFASAAASAGFTDGEVRLITDSTAEIEVKFKILEWINALRPRPTP